MANKIYTPAISAMMQGQIDLLTDDLRVILVDTALYTVDLVNHDFLDDVAAGARIAVSTTLQNPALQAIPSSDGMAFDADDHIVSSVSGDSVEALIIYKHTGVESTSNLIAYIDSGTNLPFTPNGGDILLTWPGTPTWIFVVKNV